MRRLDTRADLRRAGAKVTANGGVFHGRPAALVPAPAARDDTPAAASEHTAAFVPLAFAFFEEVLGTKFPHAAFHQASTVKIHHCALQTPSLPMTAGESLLESAPSECL